MSYPQFVKDPTAVLDYSFDWSNWLATGDTISTATWTVPSGITKVSQSESTTVALAWFSGGTAGTRYTIKCTITTYGGRTDERTMRILVEDQ